MLFNLGFYCLILLSGLSLESSTLTQLRKHATETISIYDFIYFDLSEYEQGDKINFRLSFDSYESDFNSLDFYIHYCESDTFSDYASCSYKSEKQNSHKTKDYNDDYDDYDYDYDYDDDDYDYDYDDDDDYYDDDDYDYDYDYDDYHVQSSKVKSSKVKSSKVKSFKEKSSKVKSFKEKSSKVKSLSVKSFTSDSYNYKNTYEYTIKKDTSKKYLIFYFTNFRGYYNDMYNVKIEHYLDLTLVICLIIIGIIIIALIIYFIKRYCKRMSYTSRSIETPLVVPN